MKKYFVSLWAMLLGAMIFCAGCADDFEDDTYDDGYTESSEYSVDAGYEDPDGILANADNVEIAEIPVDTEDFGNGAVNGGNTVASEKSAGMRSVRRGGNAAYNSGITTYGSSGKLEGTIAVVTILANDTECSWDLTDKADFNMYSMIYKNLRVGCSWITQACAEYGRNVNFVWDWDKYPELIYRATVDRSIGSNYLSSYYDMCEFISSNIDSEGIKSDLGANGIVYMVCVDTPSTNTTASSTFSWTRDCPQEYEMCFMLMNYKGQINAPATFAHELLHTFGAPDLYYAGKYGISDQYVKDAASSGLNDIMRVTWDLNTGYYDYNSVYNKITDITAYYLGLTDYSDSVQSWGFEQSDYAYYGDAGTAAGQGTTVDVQTGTDDGGSAGDGGSGTGGSPEVGGDSGSTGSEESYDWWNMLDPNWTKDDWQYNDGEWYIWDEETQYFYIYMEEYGVFAAMDSDDNVYWLDNNSGEWVAE